MSSSSSAAASSSSSSGTGLAVQILHFSDWHGQVDPIPGSSGAPATGGAKVLKAYFDEGKAQQPNTIITTAGDEFGAAPPVVSLNNEVPAVKALNLMGLQVSTLGNHNFDKGITHLETMLAEAQYTVVSTNISGLSGEGLTGTGEVVAPYYVHDVNGTKVAFVGLTNPDASTLTIPANLGNLMVADIPATVTAANNARTLAAADGATVFVALAHMGITQTFNGTGTPVGPLADLAQALGGTNWDVLLGDHTNFTLNTVINGLRTVECRSQGREFAQVTLDLNPTTRDVVGVNVTIVSATLAGLSTTRQAEVNDPNNPIKVMLDPYTTATDMLLNPKISEATAVFPFGGMPPDQRVRENAVANLVADSLYFSDLLFGEPTPVVDLAIINGGGVRDRLPSGYTSMASAFTSLCRPPVGTTMDPDCATGQNFDLVLGDAYAVLPFGNGIVWVEMTGAEIWRALENGVDQLPSANGKFAQVSGVTFTYDIARPANDRVLAVKLWSNGADVPNDDTQTFTVATSDFLFYGGDGYNSVRGNPVNPATVRPTLMAEAFAELLRATYEGQDRTVGTMDDGAAQPITDARNTPVATVVINEVVPHTSSGTEDRVELKVLTDGNLLGLRLVAAGPMTPDVIAVFGDRGVKAGDLVVVHLFTDAELTARMLVANEVEIFSKDNCVRADCDADAWDVVGAGWSNTGTPLPHTTRRVLQVENTRGVIMDVLPYSAGVTSVAGYATALTAAQTAGQWLPANCGGVACDSTTSNSVSFTYVDTTLTSTTSIVRASNAGVPVDTNTAADWSVATSSMGAENP